MLQYVLLWCHCGHGVIFPWLHGDQSHDIYSSGIKIEVEVLKSMMSGCYKYETSSTVESNRFHGFMYPQMLPHNLQIAVLHIVSFILLVKVHIVLSMLGVAAETFSVRYEKKLTYQSIKSINVVQRKSHACIQRQRATLRFKGSQNAASVFICLLPLLYR